MNIYIIFGGDIYYPKGGGGDFLCSTDDYMYAKAFVDGYIKESTLRWAHVWDCELEKILYEVSL